MYKVFLFYHNAAPLILINFLNEFCKSLIMSVVFSSRQDGK